MQESPKLNYTPQALRRGTGPAGFSLSSEHLRNELSNIPPLGIAPIPEPTLPSTSIPMLEPALPPAPPQYFHSLVDIAQYLTQSQVYSY